MTQLDPLQISDWSQVTPLAGDPGQHTRVHTGQIVLDQSIVDAWRVTSGMRPPACFKILVPASVDHHPILITGNMAGRCEQPYPFWFEVR